MPGPGRSACYSCGPPVPTTCPLLGSHVRGWDVSRQDTSVVKTVMPIRLAATLLVLGLAAGWGQPRDGKPAAGFRGEFLLAFADAQNKVLDLAKAVPADKYSWRPTAGVRSTGEVYMHIANGNRLLLMFMKGTPPRDQFEKAIETNEEREKKITEKAEIVKELESSFKQVLQALDKASEADLSRQVKFSGTDTT